MKYEALKKSESEKITDIHADSDEKNLCFRVLKSLLRGYCNYIQQNGIFINQTLVVE